MKYSEIPISYKVNRWTVISKPFVKNCTGNRKRTYYTCKCECGTIREIIAQALLSKNKLSQSKSCGCYKSEVKSRQFSKMNYKHGKNGTRLHRIWLGMKNRCNNSNHPSFQYWGGKGVTVCEDWQQSFMSFYNWAISNGYKSHLTIDRIDNDGNYEPNNCRWATYKQQANNRSNNINT